MLAPVRLRYSVTRFAGRAGRNNRYTLRMEPIRLKATRYDITAARDDNGVPHVEAPGWREALYGWGYMHAIDRPTQLYFARAVASGRAAERIANKH